ncbi:MAG: hypothetical protein SGJ27_04210 [Candidatus Melainabacteria bacterium]|nr:hypothetical protein [Candidatus Melainabacteria bacterium]
MNRPDAPPTAPPGTNRYSGSGDGNYQAPPGQLPGFTGAGQPGASSGYGQPSFLGGQAGGGQPGSVAGQPGFGGQGAPGGWNPTGAGQIPGMVPGMSQPGMPPLPVQPTQGGVMPDFFKGIVGKRINPGTILTGVSENNLSSVKSKRGDVFAIALPHGLINEGVEIIPPNSRILGVVVDASAAKFQRGSMPGRLSISLKTIVFPDGRTAKINGMIDHNPAHDQTSEPKVKMAGQSLGDYGQAVKGMLYSSVSGIAWVHNRTLRGKEFLLKIGDPVSVKLNTSLDVAKMDNPVASLNSFNGLPPGAVPGVPGLMQGGGPSSIPGLAPGAVPGFAPGFNGQGQAPGGFGGVPGMNQGGVPGLTGQSGGMPPQYGAPQSGSPNFAAATGSPQYAPNAGSGLAGFQNSSQLPPVNQGTFFPNNLQSPNQLPSGGVSQEPAGFETDPNSIFKTPISSPQVSTPEPF